MTRQIVENGESRRRRSTSESNHSSDSAATSSASSFSDENGSQKRRKKKEKKNDHREKRERRQARKERSSRKTESRTKKRRHRDDNSEDDKRKRRRLYKEAKRLLKTCDLGIGAANSPHAKESSHSKKAVSYDEKISEEDYYLKNNEFSMWLKEQHGIFFSDLSSEESHKLFNNFVAVWNSCMLSDKYYEGISRGPRTSHNWRFKDLKGIPGEDEEEKLLLDRQIKRTARKKFEKEQAAVLDELLPKATGRERIIEKKALRKEMTRDRGMSPDLLSEKDILGGGDDFQKRLAHERAKREIRAKEKATIYNAKFAAHAQKEATAMDQIRALVDSAGGKIVIPKREDT